MVVVDKKIILIKKHVLQSLLKWYHNKFGGEISTSQYDQSSPCLKYRTMELIFISNRLPSTNNRTIDHLGFRVESTDINLQEACEYLMTNDAQIEIKQLLQLFSVICITSS